MLNISNLDESQQTKEGFIKSMVLFVLMLAFCFAPFLAFSQSRQVSLGHTSIKKGMIKSEIAKPLSEGVGMAMAE
jgi:hypothetical protein